MSFSFRVLRVMMRFSKIEAGVRKLCGVRILRKFVEVWKGILYFRF